MDHPSIRVGGRHRTGMSRTCSSEAHQWTPSFTTPHPSFARACSAPSRARSRHGSEWSNRSSASPASSPGSSPSPQPVDGSSAHVLATTSRAPRPPVATGHRRVELPGSALRGGWQALSRWRASQQPKATYDHPRHDSQSQQGEGAGLQESSLTVSFTHLSPSTRRPASPVRRSESDVLTCGHARISTMTAPARISLGSSTRLGQRPFRRVIVVPGQLPRFFA